MILTAHFGFGISYPEELPSHFEAGEAYMPEHKAA